MRTAFNIPGTLWLILCVGLALRLLGAWCGNLMFDESAHLALADTIDLHPDRFHFVFRTLDHPLLSIYVLKLSGLLFGESNLGLRVLHVLFGTATVVPVYFLGRRVHSSEAGLWGAALLAVDQFHISWSRMFMPEVIMLFFWSLALLQMLRVAENRTTGGFVLLGLCLGLAYLAKETGILLLPVVSAFLILNTVHRNILWDPRWYLANGIFLAVIAPDVVWNLYHFSESYFLRDAEMLSHSFRLQLKPLSLFLGELVREFIDENALDVNYEQGNAYVCHWVAGLLYLASVAAAFRGPFSPARRLLLVAFLFVFVFFTILPGGDRFDPFWWASPCLVSAVVLAGMLVAQLARRFRFARWAGVLALCYLGGQFVPLALSPGQGYSRTTVAELAAYNVQDAEFALRSNDLATAKTDLIYALNLNGPDATVYYYLGYIHSLQKNDGTAELFLSQALELEPKHAAARQLLGRVRDRRRESRRRGIEMQR